MPDSWAATEITYTGVSSEIWNGLFMASRPRKSGAGRLPPPAGPPPPAGSRLPPPPAAGSRLPPPPAAGSRLPPPPAAGSRLPPPPAAGSRLPRPAEQVFPRVLPSGRLTESGQRVSGRPAQVLRDLDRYGDKEVPVRAVCPAYPLPANPERAPVRGTWRDANAYRCTPVGRKLDFRAERRLVEADRYGHREVVCRTPEHRVRRDMHPHVQVTGWPASLARGAFAPEPDPLAIGNTGRDACLDVAGAHGPPTACADRAGIIHHQAPAPALAAGFGEREAPQVPARLPGALAGRAYPGHRPGLGAGAMAGRARPLAGQAQGHGNAIYGVAEGQRCFGLHIRTATWPCLGSPATEHSAEQVTQAAASPWLRAGPAEQVAQVEGEAAARSALARGPEAAPAEERACVVIFLAALGVGQDVVRLRDLLEPLLGLGVTLVGIWVKLTCEFPV